MKLNGAVGKGIFLESLKISRHIRLPYHSSILQIEVSVIQAEVQIKRDMYFQTADIGIAKRPSGHSLKRYSTPELCIDVVNI